MSTLYWLTVLGNINFIALLTSCIFVVVCFLTSCEYFDEYGNNAIKKACKISFIGILVSLPLYILIPSKTELYAIYGVGSVINYAKGSKEMQKLLDNAVKALNVYLENIQERDSTSKVK